MRPGSTSTLEIQRVDGDVVTSRSDIVATEEPLEIRVAWMYEETPQTRSVSVTMRTPGNDFELAAGFLLTEGIVGNSADIQGITYCTDPDIEQEYNVVKVYLKPGMAFDPATLTRNFYTTSSCGVCGKASLEALRLQGCATVNQEGPKVRADVISKLPDMLREAQGLFDKTGGIHAAGLFDAQGNLLTLREDVGRHNAMDKVIGHHLIKDTLPLSDYLVMVSGRTSWELMQKAMVAGIPMLVAVGAPSSLAVDVAKEFGMTLVGFTRNQSFNIYAGVERITNNA